MDSKLLNRLMIDKFPNLLEKYRCEVSWQEGDFTGSHVVYGDVLTPYLVECISVRDIKEVKRIFDFLEEVLSFKDEYSYNVIACSVIGSVTYLLLEYEHLQSFLGCESRIVFKEFEKITKKTDPLSVTN